MSSTVGTAVLVHGSWSSPADWTWVCELLNEAAVDCEAVDLPSHRSPTATRRDDVDAVMAAVGRASGPVVVAGWSYGGAVIGDMDPAGTAIEHFLYIAAVPELTIDDDPGREGPPSLNDSPLILFPTTETCVLDDETWLGEGLGTSRFSTEVLEHLWTHRRRPISLTASRAPAAREAWREVPTTVLLGRDDRLVPPPLREFSATLPVTTRIVDGDHFLLLTRPDLVAEQIRDLFP